MVIDSLLDYMRTWKNNPISYLLFLKMGSWFWGNNKQRFLVQFLFYISLYFINRFSSLLDLHFVYLFVFSIPIVQYLYTLHILLMFTIHVQCTSFIATYVQCTSFIASIHLLLCFMSHKYLWSIHSSRKCNLSKQKRTRKERLIGSVFTKWNWNLGFSDQNSRNEISEIIPTWALDSDHST